MAWGVGAVVTTVGCGAVVLTAGAARRATGCGDVVLFGLVGVAVCVTAADRWVGRVEAAELIRVGRAGRVSTTLGCFEPGCAGLGAAALA